MKAIQYRTYGGYQENRLVDLERTRLKEGEVLVEMRTVGINPLDNTFRSGHIYLATPENLPRVGGQTGVGVVVGSGNTAFKVGDRVFVSSPALGLAADGTWREFVSAPASALSRVPAEIDDDHAAAFLAGAGYLSAQQLQRGAYLPSQADAAAAQEFEAQTLLLQSQLEYAQAQDELTDAIGQTAE